MHRLKHRRLTIVASEAPAAETKGKSVEEIWSQFFVFFFLPTLEIFLMDGPLRIAF